MNWTPDRPTKPGKYWLSLHPRDRANLRACLVVEMDNDGDVLCAGCLLRETVIVGALWHPYVEPPDPFAEPVPSLRERVEALPDLVLGSGRVIGSAVDRGAVLALLETESQ